MTDKYKLRRKEYYRKWVRKNQEKVREYQKQYRYHKSAYSLGDYGRMLEKQQGLCAICGEAPEKLVVDHHHKSGVVRELLCYSCNLGLGNFRDNAGILEKAIEYLLKHETAREIPQERINAMLQELEGL
jgi:hypothetical protein